MVLGTVKVAFSLSPVPPRCPQNRRITPIESDNKRGRPAKKQYDEEALKEQLLNNVDFIFDLAGEIKATAAELGMSPIKVKKLLITSGKLEYDETRQIQRLQAYGKSMKEIQEELYGSFFRV